MKTNEIVYGNSMYFTISNSNLKTNEIIKFNTVFSIADLSLISQYKMILPKEFYGKEINYNFKDEINKLYTALKNKNKIRIWCSYQDADSYILLTYICNIVKNTDCNLYVTYSDDYNNVESPAMLREKELEKLAEYEHKLTNLEILKLSEIWENILNTKSDMRIIENKELKLVSYNYFDNIILNKLNKLGTVLESKLAIELLKEYHLEDSIFTFLIDRLIKNKKIDIIEKSNNNRAFDNIIAINKNYKI